MTYIEVGWALGHGVIMLGAPGAGACASLWGKSVEGMVNRGPRAMGGFSKKREMGIGAGRVVPSVDCPRAPCVTA
mgnify:CR=1 FL=1